MHYFRYSIRRAEDGWQVIRVTVDGRKRKTEVIHVAKFRDQARRWLRNYRISVGAEVKGR